MASNRDAWHKDRQQSLGYSVLLRSFDRLRSFDAEVRVGEPVAGGYHVQDRLEKAARYASIFQDRTMSGDERLDAVRSEDQNYQQEQP